MIEQFRLPLDTEPQSAKGPRIGRDDAATFAPLWKPQPLIRVIASAKTDFVRTIGSEHALEHVHRKQGAKRHTVEPLIVRQFANDRAAVPHDPELYGHWNPVDIIDAEAQRPEFTQEPNKCRDEPREQLRRFPARRVHCFIVCDRAVEVRNIIIKKDFVRRWLRSSLCRLRIQVFRNCEGRAAT